MIKLVFQLTAREVAELDEDVIYEYLKRGEFRLATFNSRDRERMFERMIEERGIKDGWYYQLPGGPPIGPYFTHQDALVAGKGNQGLFKIIQ